MKTIEQAKILWCPMVRVGPDSANRETREGWGLDHPVVLCIADQCAMWRWQDIRDPKCDQGYCGLGGKP